MSEDGEGHETIKGGWFKNPFRTEYTYVDESDINRRVNSGYYNEPVEYKAPKLPRVSKDIKPPLDLDKEIVDAIEAERPSQVTADVINRNKKVANLTARNPIELNTKQKERKKRLEWLIENTMSGSLQRTYQHELSMINSLPDPKGYAKDYSKNVGEYANKDYDDQGYLIHRDVKTALKKGAVPNPELRPVSKSVLKRILKRIIDG